jgi:hemoglobin/transferrin/lactoferrin receptor protein
MQHPRFKLRSLALLLAAACNTALANESATLKDVVVTATRSATEIDHIPATVTSIDRSALDRSLPADEADLFKDENDIAFARDLRRHGATRVNIRGIEDTVTCA